jgi:uncharacterized protein (TIGR03083 family)
MTDPLSLRPLIHRESDRLADRLERLAEPDWQRPTPCTEWTVADIVAHLASGASVQLLSFQRGLHGETGQPFKDTAERDALTKAKLELPAGAKAADYRREMDRLLAVMDTFTAADLDKKAWHRTGPQPISWFMSQRLGEITLHSADIHTALDGSFSIAPDAAAALAPAYLARLPRLVRPDALRNVQAVIGLGECGSLTVADGWASYSEAGAGANPTLMVKTSPATLLLMATGRVHPKDALARGELTARGDTAILERWREMFRPL